MSVAIRTVTDLKYLDDVNVTVGASVDEYALCWDNDTARFVLRAMATGVTDHGALTGLSDDDHAGYALLAGRSGGQTLYGGTAANDDITIHGTSNATRTTSYVLLQPTAGNVGIGMTSPTMALEVTGMSGAPYYAAAKINGSLVLYAASGNSPGVNCYSGSIYAQTYYCSDQTMYTQVVGNVNAKVVMRNFDTGAALTLLPSGNVGIGTITPATLLHALLTSAATNAVTNVLTIGHDTTGTAAAGFGAGQWFQLESSTTAAQDAARIQALWYEATHATRKADLVLSAYDAGGEREGLRIRGDGSGPALGFYGVAPIARAVLATGVGATVDNVISALQALGLVKQS